MIVPRPLEELFCADDATARFDDPRGLAIDAAGVVYVADLNNHRIRAVATDGTVSTLAGSATAGSADGDGALASFTSPIALALAPDGTLYVADVGTHSIRTLTAAGHVGTLAGGAGAGSRGVRLRPPTKQVEYRKHRHPAVSVPAALC